MITITTYLKKKMYIIVLFLLFGPFNNAYPKNSPSNAEIAPQRIIGGNDAPSGSAPHMAALVYGENLRRVFCGGSIFSTHHILTAAHCIDAVLDSGLLMPSFRAIIGSHRWNSTRYEVYKSDYTNHPKWDSEMVKYDVGVLIVTEELKLNEKIVIIKLDLNWIGGGEDSFVTGWGAMGLRIENNIMGDSGSALVSEETGRQIGIVSWGFECAVGAPDVFARISGIKDFLMAALKG